MADEVTLVEFHPSPFRKRVRNSAYKQKGSNLNLFIFRLLSLIGYKIDSFFSPLSMVILRFTYIPISIFLAIAKKRYI